MNYLTIKDWQEWQSYRKDRGTPPWIKVHRCLLSNPKWAILSDAEKGQLISIWIVAADNGGQIPNDGNIVRKICQLDTPPNLNKFKDLKFFEQDGCQLDANLTPSCQPLDAPETETEVYRGEVYRGEVYSKETEIEKSNGDFDNFWNLYGKIGNKQQAIKSYNKSIKEGANHEIIIRGVEKYQSYCRAIRQEQRFIKHGATWLNNRGWEDDYTISINNAANQQDKHQRTLEAAARGHARADNPDF